MNKKTDLVIQLQKKPIKAFASVIVARKKFDNKSRRLLPIFCAIDSYNYNKKKVDIANQRRSAYQYQQKTLRN